MNQINMKEFEVRKFAFYHFNDDISIEENTAKKNIKDEYTGKDLKVASDILAKKEIIVEQDHYTKEKIEILKLESFNKGWAECEVAQKKLLDKVKEDNIHNILEKIQANLANINETIESKYENLSKDCVELSYIIAEKLVGKLNKKFPNEAILEFLSRNLPLLSHTNEIKIMVNPDNFIQIEDYLNNSHRESMIKIKLIKDDLININDCKIDWGNGVIKKDTKQVKEDLEEIFKNNL